MGSAYQLLVICTHGTQNVIALTAAGAWIEQPIIADYALHDSNGAGDAVFVGVLYGHASGCVLRQALRIGAITSGLCVATPELAAPTLIAALIAVKYQRVCGKTKMKRFQS